MDPIADHSAGPSGWGLYVYSGNNGPNRVDPSGLSAQAIADTLAEKILVDALGVGSERLAPRPRGVNGVGEPEQDAQRQRPSLDQCLQPVVVGMSPMFADGGGAVKVEGFLEGSEAGSDESMWGHHSNGRLPHRNTPVQSHDLRCVGDKSLSGSLQSLPGEVDYRQQEEH